MPRIWQLMVLVWMTSVVATAALGACPYCPTSEPTLSEKLATSDAACIVKFLSSTDGEDLSMQTTTFEVVELMRPTKSYHPKDEIVTTFGTTAAPGELFLLMGQEREGEMEWSLPVEVSEASIGYIRRAPSPEMPISQRLSYFLDYLPFQNSVISNDAFSEFSWAKFEDVAQLAPKLKREKIRRWLEDPNPQLDVRRSFYGMLLGLCGNNDDAEYLRAKILEPIPPDKNRLHIPGMMGGFLMLQGPEGLQLLLKEKLFSLPAEIPTTDPRIDDVNGLRMTLLVMWDYRRAQFGEAILRDAMRQYLIRPQFAEMAIVDLARWKDWGSLDQLIAEYGKFPWDTPSAQAKVIGFALSCQKDVPAGGDTELPPHAVKAQKFLDSLDPILVESIKRNGNPTPLRKPKSGNDRAAALP